VTTQRIVAINEKSGGMAYRVARALALSALVRSETAGNGIKRRAA